VAERGYHPAGTARQMLAILASGDRRPLLANITAPTLIVGGDRDPYIPLEHTRFLAESIPGARLHVLSRTGHMFFAESTAEYQGLLIGWLEENSERPEGQVALPGSATASV
jgi:pimeloyl-ACP methyl ester carboxylesterase